LYKLSREVGDEKSKSRIEFLNDGVFAIVMTLLVLEIAVPQLSHSEAQVELPRRLLELWPLLLSYVTSFMILGLFWIIHEDMFHHIKRANRIFLWLNILYLMLIAFIPFSTSLVGEYGDQQISVVIYGINIVVAAFWMNMQWWYATKDHHLVDSDLDPTIITTMSRHLLVGPITYLIAVVLSFASVQISLVMYIAIPLYYLIPARRNNPRLWFIKSGKR
jgi:uncharacterized membrane protein